MTASNETEPGALDVAATARLLGALNYSWTRLFRITASWIAGTAATDVKCALGRALYLDSEAIEAIRGRLVELRAGPEPLPASAVLTGLTRLSNKLLQAPDEAARLGVRRLWQDAHRALLDTYRQSADPLWDEPGHRLSRRLDDLLAEADAVTGGTGTVPAESAAARPLAAILATAAIANENSPTQGPADPPNGDEAAVPLTFAAARGAEVRVVAPEDMGAVPVPADKTLVHVLHTIAYCVEISAVDVCSQMIAAYPDLPWRCHRDLARQVYDEVRHYELLKRRVTELGGRMGDYPVHTGIWDYFMLGADPLEKLCIQQVIQESHGLDSDMVFSQYMAKSGDERTAVIFDFIGADETQHVRLGCRWMLELAEGDADRVLEIFEQGYRRLLENRFNPRYPVQERERLIAGMTPAQIGRAREVVLAMIRKQLSALTGSGTGNGD
jgi:uncharacterized ferritin-like protein (DUF455 family)